MFFKETSISHTMREVFVSELVKGLLGPRNGSRETFPLDTTPLSEYITGVISPKITESQLESDPDMDAATLDTTESGDEDQTGDDAVKPLSVMSPSLDPKMQPNSFGLSFVIQSLTPEINVCATWGLYVRSNKVWQREPGKSVWKINLRKSNNSLFLDREGQLRAVGPCKKPLRVQPCLQQAACWKERLLPRVRHPRRRPSEGHGHLRGNFAFLGWPQAQDTPRQAFRPQGSCAQARRVRLCLRPCCS